MSSAILIALGYGLIAYVLVRDINKARKVYKFNYVRLVAGLYVNLTDDSCAI